MTATTGVTTEPDPTAVPTTPFRGVGLTELRQITAKESSGWLVDGLIPAGGVTMVTGAPFAGKSTLLASVSACIAAGVPFAGRRTKSGPVVWVYQDRGSRRALLDNLSAACAGVGAVETIPITVITPETFSLDSDRDVEWLREYLDELGAVAAILDSLRRVSSFDENRSCDTSLIAKSLALLTSGNQRAIMPVHHHGKDGKVRGSTDLEAACESVLRVEAKEGHLNVRVRHHAAADQATRLRVERTGSTLRYLDETVPLGSPSVDVKKTKVAKALHAALKSNATLSTTAARKAVRAAGVKASNASIDKVLAQLVEVELFTMSSGARGENTYERAQ
jgi:hypothetical protein